jgi:hypothetical protein
MKGAAGLFFRRKALPQLRPWFYPRCGAIHWIGSKMAPRWEMIRGELSSLYPTLIHTSYYSYRSKRWGRKVNSDLLSRVKSHMCRYGRPTESCGDSKWYDLTCKVVWNHAVWWFPTGCWTDRDKCFLNEEQKNTPSALHLSRTCIKWFG